MNYAPEPIGAGKYTAELAVFLASQGYRVEVVTAQPHYPGWSVRAANPWFYRRRKADGITVTHCPLLAIGKGHGVWRLLAPLTFAIAAAPVVVWRVLRSRPDTVVCVEPTLFSTPAALLAAWAVGARRVLHVQDLEVEAAFATGHLKAARLRRAALAIERRVLARFDQVVTISDAMAERLAAKGVARHRLSVIRNWIDPERLKPSRPPGHFRRLLSIGPEQRVALYAGHLGAKQALPNLLDAIARLPKDGSVITVVAGEGPMRSAVVQASAWNPHLRVLPLQPADLFGDLLAMADLHLLPQHPGSADLVMPSKLGALLASGRGLVVTAEPGTELATWLAGAALVVKAGDPQALADAIMAGLGPPDAERLARAASLAAELDAAHVLPCFADLLAGRFAPDRNAATAAPDTVVQPAQ